VGARVTLRQPLVALSIERFRGSSGARGLDTHVEDLVAVEEPLVIRVAGETLVTTLRTPGADRELAAGYLFTEGNLRTLDQLATLTHCGRPSEPDYGNVFEVTPAPGLTLESDLVRSELQPVMNSACGVCGSEQIFEVGRRCSSLADVELTLHASELFTWVARLGNSQTGFASSGGLHAAIAIEPSSEHWLLYEDVGRHNAVDKVIGRLFLDAQLPAESRVLLVTSRASFEIVRKACIARFPIVVCLSAPTSLAVELAREFGITLLGFVRDNGFNVYSRPDRVRD
jgi:FdhD protein